MVDLMDKTLGAVQNLLFGSDGSNRPLSQRVEDPVAGRRMSSTNSRSTSFQDFIHLIGTASTKSEEDNILKKETEFLQQRLSDPSLKPNQTKECLARALYCELLGHPVPFAYIHAVQLAQRGTGHAKACGYLAASLFFHEDHELSVLLVNTVQKDLNSTNALEVCLALRAVCDLSPEMTSVVLPSIQKLLAHSKDIVRKKAVLVMHCLMLKSPDIVKEVESSFQQLLCDPDPSVMAASLHIFALLIESEPSKYAYLQPTFIQLLKKVISGQLPEEYEHHGVPAPWFQIKLLRLIKSLSPESVDCHQDVIDVVLEALKHCDMNSNAAFGVSYECMLTAAEVGKSDDKLLTSAFGLISKYLRSQNNNLKYVALNVLSSAVQSFQSTMAAEHQATMVECLYHPDESLRRKTLDLLYKMANSSNVQVICTKMTEYLSTTDDRHLKEELVNRIMELTEQFSPELDWSLQTISSLFIKGGPWLRPEVTFRFLEQLKKGSGDKDLDTETNQQVVHMFFAQSRVQDPPPGLVQVTAWILGEFATSCPDITPHMILRELVHLARAHWHSEVVLTWVLEAIIKIVVKHGTIASPIFDLLAIPTRGLAIQNQQMIKELNYLVHHASRVASANLAYDTGKEQDFTLSFLDNFVADHLVKNSSKS